MANIQWNDIGVTPNIHPIELPTAASTAKVFTMSSVTVHTPAQVAEPRGARVAVAAVLALREAWAGLRRGLAQRRAYNRRIAEAAELRGIARAMDRHDPRVAAEMRAAADRHELG